MITKVPKNFRPIVEAIGRKCHENGKVGEFNEAHPRNRPVTYFFQESTDGLVLFVVLYTMACRYGQCRGCNLVFSASQYPVRHRDLFAQINWIFDQADVQANAGRIEKVIFSNQGSVLDQVTLPGTVLMYFVGMMNDHFPRVKIFCPETRISFIDSHEIGMLRNALLQERHLWDSTKAELEFAIGMEAFDPEIRRWYDKGFHRSEFQIMLERHARPARDTVRIKIHFMQKPIVMSDEDAVRDVMNGIDYLAEQATAHGVRINMHLNPTYAARHTFLEEKLYAGDWDPPKLEDVIRAVLHAKGKNITVFVGLNDEGMAVTRRPDGTPVQGTCLRPEHEHLHVAIEQFNKTGDFTVLERAVAA